MPSFLSPKDAGAAMRRARAALAAGEISCHAIVVLDCLLWNAGRRHGCPSVRASLRWLARLTDSCRDTILKGIEELVRIGVLAKIRHRVLVAWGGSIASRQATNEYTILTPATESTTPTASPESKKEKERCEDVIRVQVRTESPAIDLLGRRRRAWEARWGARCTEARAVQRSIHDAQAKDSVDSTEGDAVACIGDVAGVVETQNVGRE